VVCIWDTKATPRGPEGSKPQMLQAHTEEGSLTAIAYQARGFLLASAGLDGQVFLWQPTNTRNPQVGNFKFESAEASVLSWSADDKSLAAGSGAGAVAVFRAG
jgi:WD40 repeat protein